MLIDRYPAEDVFARVPELANQADPVLLQLDRLLEDDLLFQQVRDDLVRRHRLTAVHGRHSTPAEALLRLLAVKHLYGWSFEETERRVADSLVLRWFTRVYFRRVPDDTTRLALGAHDPARDLARAHCPRRPAGGSAPGDAGPQTPGGWDRGGDDDP